MSAAPARPLLHPALERGAGEPLASAQLTDRERLAILLQGSSLLSHLDYAGLRLAEGWAAARVDRGGVLRGVRVSRGTFRDLPQSRLADLTERLFRAGDRIAGRGQARRVAARLLDRWRQSLISDSPDEAVNQILRRATFLWERRFGESRSTLAADHASAAGRRLWVAGPGWFRRSLLAAGPSRRELEECLRSSVWREHWQGPRGEVDPLELVARGHWRSAVGAWFWSPPKGPVQRLGLARALYALGRFEEALAAVGRLRAPAARALRLRCLHRLGRLEAARRALTRLDPARLDPAAAVDLAELAARVFGDLGLPAAADPWVDRALRSRDRRLRLRAELAAVEVGRRSLRLGAAERHLEAARPAAETSELAWRWHQAGGRLATARGDPAAAEGCFRRALSSRRRLTELQSSDLWRDLALARMRRADLRGAERACAHAVRLSSRAEFGGLAPPALVRLAEIRLRRGRMLGVRKIVERLGAQSFDGRDVGRAIRAASLAGRYELARGRPGEALRVLEEALGRPGRRGRESRVGELRILAARALGWLDRPGDARAMLRRCGAAAAGTLEPEERPALWALAGARRLALEAASDGSPAALWRQVLERRAVAAAGWADLGRLGDFRAARLVADIDRVSAHAVPAALRARAAATLRRVGAGSLAERLEADGAAAWRALRGYLEQPSTETRIFADLFRRAGYPDVRLVWESEDREMEIVAGRTGGEELAAPLDGGLLLLQAPALDPVLKTLFALAARELRPVVASPAGSNGGIVGSSAALVRALDRASRLATRDVPVLVLGETGTGKELVARRIHRLSGRARRTFLPVNCGALPESLRLSDLFGHARGAFTGADRERAGIFEAARGGTVFLDEIGDLPFDAQAMLLRLLQEGEIRRVGESLHRRVDVRIVSATHHDLARDVKEGRFRRDLFYRLRVGAVTLPPLRDRGDDLWRLCDHFLSEASQPALRLSVAARDALRSHTWPGNVRELKNRLLVAAAFAGGRAIRPEDLELRRKSTARGQYHQRVDDYRRRLVGEALAATGGRRAAAARRLGLSRQALSYLIRRLEVEARPPTR